LEEGAGGGGSGKKGVGALGVEALRAGQRTEGTVRTPSFLLREEEGAGGWRFREGAA
jgi:hypothetical protein